MRSESTPTFVKLSIKNLCYHVGKALIFGLIPSMGKSVKRRHIHLQKYIYKFISIQNSHNIYEHMYGMCLLCTVCITILSFSKRQD
jgi:hypothetical protein